MNEEIKQKLVQVLIRHLNLYISSSKPMSALALARLLEVYLKIAENKEDQIRKLLDLLKNNEQN